MPARTASFWPCSTSSSARARWPTCATICCRSIPHCCSPTRRLVRRGNFPGPMDQLICSALESQLDAEIALSPGFRWGVTALSGQPLTMEDVLAETAMSYPETYVQEMTGSQIKDVLEDICDNLFNPDPYYQQGGDMVRVGGFTYTCTPTENIGKRISGLKLDSGKTLEAGKSYKVAGWASVNPQQGRP